jgi:indole-3-glycerol phosphate synthase
MGLLSAARAAHVDSVAVDSQAHHRRPPIQVDTQGFGLIAEIKFSAPSAGILRQEDDPIAAAVKQARVYEAAGARAISVLTEPTRFGGSIEHLKAVCAAVDIPVMRKDFLVDPVQVLEARAAGASGILLILRMLDDVRLDQMVELAHELGMFVLLEAFDAEDLARAAHFKGVLLGLNCRDLSTLAVDNGRFKALTSAFVGDQIRVAESGMIDPEDARQVAGMGYTLALVGSALMRADDPGALIVDMTAAGQEGL